MKIDVNGQHVCRLHINQLITQAVYTEKLPLTAKLSQRLFWLVRSYFLASQYHRGTKVNLGSEVAFIKERRKQIASKHWFMIHPFSMFLLGWQIFVFVMWTIDLIFIPYSIFFRTRERNIFGQYIVFGDAIACINMFIKFFTAYYHLITKEIEFDLSITAVKYIKNDFIIDLIGALPLQLIVIPLKKKSLRETMCFFKMFRIHCVITYLDAIFFQFNTTFKIQHIINLCLKSVIFVQFITGFYYQITKTFHFINGEVIGKELWIVRENILYNSSVWTRYITTLYFVSGFMSTSGQSYNVPKTNPELVVIALITLSGYIYLTYLTVSVYQSNIYSNSVELQYDTKLLSLRHYICKKGLPYELEKKIFTYVNYKWEGKYFHEERIMKTLSRNLRLEIKLYDCEKLLYAVPFFKNLPKKLILNVVECLHLEVHLPGEAMLEVGVVADTLYLLKCGSVEIKRSNGNIKVTDGAYFGEPCLTQTNWVSEISAVTMEISEIYHLGGEDWKRCVTFFPEMKGMFDNKI